MREQVSFMDGQPLGDVGICYRYPACPAKLPDHICKAYAQRHLLWTEVHHGLVDQWNGEHGNSQTTEVQVIDKKRFGSFCCGLAHTPGKEDEENDTHYYPVSRGKTFLQRQTNKGHHGNGN